MKTNLVLITIGALIILFIYARILDGERAVLPAQVGNPSVFVPEPWKPGNSTGTPLPTPIVVPRCYQLMNNQQICN